jgi:muramoyltetrapeptide carboxypeptidase LdcA involved in peptidoglycan recycling
MPSLSEWRDKILFLETSEECPTPAAYQTMLQNLKCAGILSEVRAIITGKPQNERYYTDYCRALLTVTQDLDLPIMTNLNFGHAYPRTALPYELLATVDLDAQTLTIDEPYFRTTD